MFDFATTRIDFSYTMLGLCGEAVFLQEKPWMSAWRSVSLAQALLMCVIIVVAIEM